MKICPKCGYANDDKEIFCRKCGNMLPATPDAAAGGAAGHEDGPEALMGSGEKKAEEVGSSAFGVKPERSGRKAPEKAPEKSAHAEKKQRKEKKGTGGLIAGIVLALLSFVLIGAGAASLKTPVTPSPAPDPENDVVAENGKTWTILTYMCGSSLEYYNSQTGGSMNNGMGSKNILEVRDSVIPANVNFLLETGGAQNWNDGDINADKLQRFEIRDRKLNLVDEEDLADMGESDTLSSYIRWAKKNYPADHYALVLWGHGNGVFGVCYDSNYDDDGLTMPELRAALEKGSIHFDIVGFDACQMASLGVAGTVSSYADYMIASQDNEPGTGWDYVAWMSYMAQHEDSSTEDIGKAIIDGYMEKCEANDSNDFATLALIGLDKIDRVSEYFDNYSGDMLTALNDSSIRSELLQNISNAEAYQGTFSDGESFDSAYDLYDMCRRNQDLVGNSAKTVMNAVKSAVVYSACGDSRRNSNGISVISPFTLSDNGVSYLESLSDDSGYVSFITDYNAIAEEESQAAEEADLTSEDVLAESIDEDAMRYVVHFDTTSTTLMSIAMHYWRIGEGNDGNSYAMGIGESGNAYAYTDDTGVVVESLFDGTHYMLGDTLVDAFVYQADDDYIVYGIPVRLNGTQTYLWAIYSAEDDVYALIGAADDPSSDDFTALSDGDEITTIHRIFDVNAQSAEEAADYEQYTITYQTGVTTLESATLPDGNYFVTFAFTDMAGNTYYTKGAFYAVSGGQVTTCLLN